MTHEVRGERLLLPSAPLAFVLELFVFQHVKAHETYVKTAKDSFVAYLGMSSLKSIEQIYNYLNINVLVLGLEVRVELK